MAFPILQAAPHGCDQRIPAGKRGQNSTRADALRSGVLRRQCYGGYEITGTADAGSEIFYGDNKESVYADSDGTFTIPGTLDENSGVLSLCAQDSAGNKSTSRFALITEAEHRYRVHRHL